MGESSRSVMVLFEEDNSKIDRNVRANGFLERVDDVLVTFAEVGT